MVVAEATVVSVGVVEDDVTVAVITPGGVVEGTLLSVVEDLEVVIL